MLNNQIEELNAKWEKVQQFISIEAKLRDDLADAQNSYASEKKNRIK